jgi:hypothetical protein
MVVKLRQPLGDATLAIGLSWWFQNLCLSQEFNQTVKTEGIMRKPALGRGAGAWPIQSLDVAVDGNLADIGDGDVVLFQPHPEVAGSPQMQANGSSRIVCFSKGLGNRWQVRAQKALPHPKKRSLLRKKLLDH